MGVSIITYNDVMQSDWGVAFYAPGKNCYETLSCGMGLACKTSMCYELITHGRLVNM